MDSICPNVAEPTSLSSEVDALVIGGGPAGLSAALAFARQLHTVILFDSNLYRNAKAARMHVVSTWDNHPPAEYRDAAREELTTRYDTVWVIDTEVKRVVKLDQGRFTAHDADGKQWTGRKLLLATGSKDVFLDIPGFSECWGTSM